MSRSRVLVALAVVLGFAVLLFARSWRAPSPSTPTTPALEAEAPPVEAPSAPRDRILPAPPVRIAPRPVTIEPPDVSTGPAQFSGRVISSATGAGVASAELTFAHGNASYQVTTSRDGDFVFEAPDAVVYLVAEVIADGFTPFAPMWGESPLALTARPGRRISGLMIALDPERVVIGTVLGPDAAPVEAATVHLFVPSGPLRELAALPTVPQTDAEGRFRFTAPAGTIVEADHPSFAPVSVRVTEAHLDKGRLTLRFGAATEATELTEQIAGLVLDENDAPVADAQVTANRDLKDRFRETPDVRVTRSNAEGRFRFTRLQRGRYTLAASAPDRVFAGAPGVVTGTDDVVLRATERGGDIAGRVTSSTPGGAVPSFTVIVSEPVGKIEELPILTRAFVDPDGAYRVGPIAAGEYRVRVVAPGFATSRAYDATVPQGGTDTVDIELTPGASVYGRVVDGETEAPIDDARVELESSVVGAALPIPVEKTVQTDDEGRFSLAGIAPGLFSVSATADGYNRRIVSSQQAVEGQATGPVTIALTPLEAPDDEPQTELAGIGAALAPQGDAVLVGQVLDQGGAAEAGLQPGDLILTIDGQSVSELDFNGIIQRIRGPVGSTVGLKIRTAAGQEKDLVVHRRAIKS